MSAAPTSTPLAPADTTPARATRNVHVRGVPQAVWRKARNNALLSNLSFRDFVITLLERCTPISTPLAPDRSCRGAADPSSSRDGQS